MTDLAAAARFELAARAKHWPARVAGGGMTQAEADADIAAWRAIEQLLAHHAVQTDLTFADLVAAAQRAIDSRSEKARLAMVGVAGRAQQEARIGALTTIRRRLIDSAHGAGSFAWHDDRKAA